MAFFNSAVDVLQTLVIALGAGLGIWGVINLLEGYGNDNPGAKSQGMKQLMAGGGVHHHMTLVLFFWIIRLRGKLMQSIIDKITEWLGDLSHGIMGNLSGMFDNVNQSVKSQVKK